MGSREEARRQPFDWAIPARLTQMIDLSKQLFLDVRELQAQLGKPATFMVQDLDIQRGQPFVINSTVDCQAYVVAEV